MVTQLEDSNKPLSGSIYIDLQEDILSGRIENGSKLTEQPLCEKYNVSRTPVREAFRQLESDGLIENIPNRGAFVRGLSNTDISDLFDLRCIFEMKAVEWAIIRMKEEELQELKENIDFMEFYTLRGDVDKVLHYNSVFHNLIYKGTHNRMLYQTLATYQTYLKLSAPSKTFSDDYLNTILREHKTIFEAFENRNPLAGIRAMEEHMKQSKIRRMAKIF